MMNRQECIPVGCVPPASVAVGDVCLGSAQGERCLPRGCTPPVNRMTDRCKNITLSQTSFAGGKNFVLKPSLRYLQTFFDAFVRDNETFGIEPRQLAVRQVGFVQHPFTRHLAITVALIRESALCKIYE